MNKLTEADNLETFPDFCPARVCLYMEKQKERMREERGKGTW